MKTQANKLLTGLLLLGLFCGLAMAVPTVMNQWPTGGSVDINETESLTFNVTLNKTANITWDVDGNVKKGPDNATFSEYLYTAKSGDSKISAVIEGAPTVEWNLNVKVPTPIPDPTITAHNPTDATGITVGETTQLDVTVDQNCSVKWEINGDTLTNTTIKLGDKVYFASAEYNFTEYKTYPIKLTATNDTTKKDDVKNWDLVISGDKVVIKTYNPQNKTGITIGVPTQLNVTVDQNCSVKWEINGDTPLTNTTIKLGDKVYFASAEYNFTEYKTYPIKLTATNDTTGQKDDKTWNLDFSKNPISITKSNPDWEEKEITVGETLVTEFNVTVSENATINWTVNDVSVQKDLDKKFSSYNYTAGDKEGKFVIKASVTANGVAPVEKMWTINVRSKYYLTGNRIWEDGAGLSNVYIWNPQSYSGFYYDLDSGEGSETMTITLEGKIGDVSRTIEDKKLVYETTPIKTDFEYKNWGKYEVIGFMAEKYFAGYIDSGNNENKTTVGKEKLDANLISDGVLAKVLIDSDDETSIYSNTDMVLEDGYSLNIVEVDVNGEKVWVQLEKDGDVVEDQFLSSDSDFIYETDLGDAEDVPIIIAHFGTVFAGQESSAVYIEGIFQISDNYIEIESGKSIGEMEVKTVNDDLIKMENDDDISLKKGKTIDIMGKLQIVVADDDVLRFAPIVEMSEAGTYELRGTVFDEDKNPTAPEWTYYNFEGFYYDIDEGLGTESLTVKKLDVKGRDIDDNNLEYRTNTTFVEFEHSNWGKFKVIGFMAEKYFAGYPKGKVIDKDVSILGDGYLSKVLIDSDEEETMYSGAALVLEEGYSLEVKEVNVNGDTVWVQLLKDGDNVEDAFLKSGEDYIYEGDLGDAEDVPLILVHFGNVFAGEEASAVFVEGIFQISDKYRQVESGDNFGEMEVDSVKDNEIVMRNDDNIDLGEDDTIALMGNVKIKVADDDTLRFYPFVEVKTDGSGADSRELKISVPDEIFVDKEIDIKVTADNKAVEAVTVKLDGKSIGKTDEDGVLSYTSTTAGDFKVTAEKEGYTTANKNMEVLEQKEEMSISVSPETTYEGERITIEVVKAIGGDAVDEAEVSINGDSIGTTGSDGTIAYTASVPGRLSISAVKEGFLDKDFTFNVKALEARFTYSDLVAPAEIKAGKEAEITVAVKNTGNAAGETEVELRVNGSFVDSQVVSLGIGESTTVTFLHAEEVPGTYTIEAGDQTTEYEVKKKTSVLLYALVVLILAVGGGAAYMFTKGGMTVESLQEKIAELTGKKT